MIIPIAVEYLHAAQQVLLLHYFRINRDDPEQMRMIMEAEELIARFERRPMMSFELVTLHHLRHMRRIISKM